MVYVFLLTLFFKVPSHVIQPIYIFCQENANSTINNKLDAFCQISMGRGFFLKKVSGTKFYHILHTQIHTYSLFLETNVLSNFHITNAYSLILTIPNLRTNNKSQVLLKSINYMYREILYTKCKNW